MLDWILERLGVVIFVLIFISQIVRGVLRARRENPPPAAKPDELEEQRRTREIQEQIRRRIAERRGGRAAAEPPPLARTEPAPAPAGPIETTQMPEPFGGPLRRMLQELEREVSPPPPPAPPPPRLEPVVVESRSAENERQQRLADELRAVNEARVLAQRRATKLADAKSAAAQSEAGLRTAVRGKVLEDLQDPASLRRAFVLREVLGTPVGLR
jgi:hypothetical protein